MDKKNAIKEYSESRQKDYRHFSEVVSNIIKKILEDKGIKTHSVTFREKSAKSLAEKIMREGKSYNALEDVTDLAGVRIITYFVSDLDKILPLIYNEFNIDLENSIDKRKSVDPKVFGYASVHLILSLSDARTQLPEYAAFKGLKCEVQVRTILQHAWAEIEHDIVYKSNEDIPFELRRKFASLAGLIEVADREFESLKKDELEIRTQIRTTIENDKIDLPINLDSLLYYLEKYHNEKDLKTEYLSKFVGLLLTCDVKSIKALDSILSPKALNEADELVLDYVPHCEDSHRCLIRYFLAVGNHFKVPLKSLWTILGCPVLAQNTQDAKKDRMKTKIHSPEKSKRDIRLYR